MEQVDHAVEILGRKDLILMHSCSTYPAYYEELNLRVIPTMRERYNVPVGYSGHETGLPSTLAAMVLGACMIERHITMDRASWGTDQAASLEPNGITRLLRDIRLIEKSTGRRRQAPAAARGADHGQAPPRGEVVHWRVAPTLFAGFGARYD